jgi:hypothetical protein
VIFSRKKFSETKKILLFLDTNRLYFYKKTKKKNFLKKILGDQEFL